MANSQVWAGSGSFITGSSTPFGFYDNDISFQNDVLKVAKFCASRLGYPSLDVEMGMDQFATCFEEAVTTYGNEVYLYQIRNNYLSLEAASTGSSLNNNVITPSLSNVIRIASDYGSEVGVGGAVDFYTGSIAMSPGIQDYDLNVWASGSASLAPGDSIEIKQIFYENIPAINRYFDPYAGTGYGTQQLLDAFGFGTQSPAINFMLMPLNFDISILQAIEVNDMVRKSGFSFEIINNKLKIFPIPTRNYDLRFRYVKNSEKNHITPPSGSFGAGDGLITNMSNVPYNNPVYSQINGPGRYWIFEYTLALAKEMLGLIRGKYQIVPIPGDTVSLNASDLLTQALEAKTSLLEKLRNDLDETSRKAQLQRRSDENVAMRDIIKDYPMLIFIG